MYTKLTENTNANAITFHMTASDDLASTLAKLTTATQDEFRIEAAKLFEFAERLGLDGARLSTAVKMPARNRLLTIAQVLRHRYSISYMRDGYADALMFEGTELEMRRKRYAMRRAGMKVLRVDDECVLETGYKFGSVCPLRGTTYTFGTVWGDRIEGAPHLISRVLKGLAKHEQVVYSAKDDLLDKAAMRYAAMVAA